MKAFFSVIWIICFVVIFSFLLSCVYGFFYPIKYRKEIISASEEFGISPAIIASVINVESSYKKDRVSAKGAIGLMQIMPATSKWIADKLNQPVCDDDLFDVNTNIRFGSFYLSYLIDYFDDFGVAVCAYNAGMGNVNNWLKNQDYTKNGKLIKIPFKETENYYNKVLKNLRYYKKKY